MNILQSICCLFSRGCGEQSEQTVAKADLGQTEAVLEKTGKEQMGHMGGDEVRDSRRA